jgi:hypothetical protein
MANYEGCRYGGDEIGDGLGWRCGCEALSLAFSILSRHLGWPGAVQVRGWGVVVVACLGAGSTRGGVGAPPTAYFPPGARGKYTAPSKILEGRKRRPVLLTLLVRGWVFFRKGAFLGMRN